jgi:hypothetical protein
MSKENFPGACDEEKIQRVLTYYEHQSEDDGLIEDEAGVESSETVMSVPRELVPKVRELIAKHNRLATRTNQSGAFSVRLSCREFRQGTVFSSTTPFRASGVLSEWTA